MNIIVSTRQGPVKGKSEKNQAVFLGIPYAAPPVGVLRFRPPIAPALRKELFDATKEPNVAWQHFQEPGSFYEKEFYEGYRYLRSEDCLTLNITAPIQKPQKLLPVFFWIHGGAFLHGNGHEQEFGGETFVQNGVLYVSINYRTGANGFLTDPALDQENPDHISGNLAILDQIAALHWVKDNIEAFGGDPHRITIAGQSAGCMSVTCLLFSPLAKGLFSQAILQSGYGIFLNFDRENVYTYSACCSAAEKLKNECGVSSIEELRQIDAADLCNAWYRVADAEENLCWVPHPDSIVIDQRFSDPYASPDPEIKIMIGSTGNDIGSEQGHLLRQAARQFGKNASINGCFHPYLYFFDHKLPGDQAGAFHSSELWYTFHSLNHCWRPMNEKDLELADQMSTYWANFVKYGNPNGDHLPEWRPYTPDDPFEKEFR